MAASLQYPCHPFMDPKKRYKCPVRFGLGKIRHSRCKTCGKRYSIQLTPNGPLFKVVPDGNV